MTDKSEIVAAHVILQAFCLKHRISSELQWSLENLIESWGFKEFCWLLEHYEG